MRHGTWLRMLLATGVFSVLGLGCGGGDDCDGFVTINATPEECRLRAERLGCSMVEVNAPTCGLFGCVRCTDDGS